MGRLLQKDLKPIHFFENREVESGYVGTETVAMYAFTVRGNVQPASNKITVEVYGKSVYELISIICPLTDDICGDCSLSVTGKEKPTHVVESIQRYSDHMIILAKKVH